MDVREKLEILADAAKYDASCASSGSKGRRAGAGGIGSTEGMGICHSYTPDGRCVSLLKILLTNWCIYDCSYCINRRSSGVRRARFSPAEVVWLTLEFYRRNYIEGLFLSSGIIRGPDYTMEQIVHVARSLRRDHGFGGYIHLKLIPNAAPELIAEAGQWADRVSVNVELPNQADLNRLAPDKELVQIRNSMQSVRTHIDEAKAEVASVNKAVPAPNDSSGLPRFADLARLRVPLTRVLPFVETVDHVPRGGLAPDHAALRNIVAPANQLDMFALAHSALHGEV